MAAHHNKNVKKKKNFFLIGKSGKLTLCVENHEFTWN